MNQKRNRGELTPQRIAKIERDRRRRREHKEEFKRLQALSVTQRNENRRLTEENEWLNYKMSDLNKTVELLRERIRELQQSQGLQETMADSFFNYANFPSPNEEVANNEPITQGPGSSQSGILNADELA